MKQGTDKGIILKTNLFNEADLSVQILINDGTKKDFVAKAALKSKKRFGGGVLEPSHYIQFSWKESPSGITYLEEAKLIESFEGIRNTYEGLQTAMSGVQLILQVSREGLEQEEIFHMLGNYLKICSTTRANKKTYLHFKIRLLSAIGILPHQTEFAAFQTTPLASSMDLHLTEVELVEVERALRPYKEDYLS